MPSTKHGGGMGGGGGDPFKNSTASSMSQKLDKPKKKRSDKNREEEQNSRRRAQNRNSQRAYRERRERRLRELEGQVQQAEQLNQTLTSAYQELRAEIDRLEAEKLQEQYYGDQNAQQGPSSSSAVAVGAYDPAVSGYYAPSSNTGGGSQGGWTGTSWDVNQTNWNQGYGGYDGYDQHGYGG